MFGFSTHYDCADGVRLFVEVEPTDKLVIIRGEVLYLKEQQNCGPYLGLKRFGLGLGLGLGLKDCCPWPWP